jgi:Ca2+:H+ antiporter
LGAALRSIYVLAAFIPAAVVLELANGPPAAIFVTAALGVVPTAALMGKATEELAERSGPGIGGLLNVTFGNFPELVIAFFALLEGLQEVVKASIIGSIISNILLVLGVAMLWGGRHRPKQTFSRTAAHAQAAMLLLALAALTMPALFQLVHGDPLPPVDVEKVQFSPDLEHLSLAVAIVLLLSYCAGLFFSLRTHRDVFNPFRADADPDSAWPVRKSVLLLALAGALVALMSEILVGSISDAAHDIGISEFFIGAIIVAIVGNAAEHWVAVLVAAKDKMDLAVNIAIGSSAQVALFVAPVLVLLSFGFGSFPLALVFNGYEVGALIFAVLIANFLVQEGESNWFEGVQLLAVYTVLVVVFLLA